VWPKWQPEEKDNFAEEERKINIDTYPLAVADIASSIMYIRVQYCRYCIQGAAAKFVLFRGKKIMLKY
jgi:hypothetical protein